MRARLVVGAVLLCALMTVAQDTGAKRPLLLPVNGTVQAVLETNSTVLENATTPALQGKSSLLLERPGNQSTPVASNDKRANGTVLEENAVDTNQIEEAVKMEEQSRESDRTINQLAKQRRKDGRSPLVPRGINWETHAAAVPPQSLSINNFNNNSNGGGDNSGSSVQLVEPGGGKRETEIVGAHAPQQPEAEAPAQLSSNVVPPPVLTEPQPPTPVPAEAQQPPPPQGEQQPVRPPPPAQFEGVRVLGDDFSGAVPFDQNVAHFHQTVAGTQGDDMEFSPNSSRSSDPGSSSSSITSWSDSSSSVSSSSQSSDSSGSSKSSSEGESSKGECLDSSSSSSEMSFSSFDSSNSLHGSFGSSSSSSDSSLGSFGDSSDSSSQSSESSDPFASFASSMGSSVVAELVQTGNPLGSLGG